MIISISLAVSMGLLIFASNVINASNIDSNDDSNDETSNPIETIMGHGMITHLDLEGGFFGIISNDGKHYDPINLPSEYKIDGLKVFFEAKLRDDMLSYHMWGSIIELVDIQKVYF